MDREIVDSVNTAVIFIVICAILTIIVLVTSLSNQAGRNFVNSVDQTVNYAYNADMNALSSYEDPLPVATLLITLEKNEGSIKSVTGLVHGVAITKITDLVNILQYEVYVECIEAEIGYYEIYVTEVY